MSSKTDLKIPMHSILGSEMIDYPSELFDSIIQLKKSKDAEVNMIKQ